jgi:Cu-processing system ATP-binding protein
MTATLSPHLAVAGIVKRFGARRVLADVSFSVPAGRLVALLGPNGSGKTTLIKSVLGLVRPDAGTITLDGVVLTGNDAVRSRLGYMPQLPRLPEHLTARDVLHLIGALRGANDDATIAQAIADFRLDELGDRPLGVCSGGQRQRVNAALAMLGGPDVLVLDEPTAGLDPESARALKDRLLIERARGTAILLTTHVIPDVEELADDVVVLHEGAVLFAGGIGGLRAVTGAPTLERALAERTRAARLAATEVA